MNPVTLCRKISGVSVWLASRMNSVAFLASSLNRTPRVLARMPTGKPWIEAQPVAMLVPQRGLYSEKRDPSTIRAMTSRGSKGIRGFPEAMPSSSSASYRGSSAGWLGPGPSLRQLRWATISRPMRIASV